MRLFVLLAQTVSVIVLSGCADQQEQVQNTGQPVNLWPSNREGRAGQ